MFLYWNGDIFSMFKFEERTALITGGAGGIGLSIAKALGEHLAEKFDLDVTFLDIANPV